MMGTKAFRWRRNKNIFYLSKLELFGISKNPIISQRILMGLCVWCFTGSGSVQSQHSLWHQNVTGYCSSEQGNEPNAADLLSWQKTGWVAVVWVQLETHAIVLSFFFCSNLVLQLCWLHARLGALVCFWHLKRRFGRHMLLCLDVLAASVYF